MKNKIGWCDRTWNPITGCSKISSGCKNCWAQRMSKRLAGRCGYPKDNPFAVTLHPERLNEPLKWKKPQRIFLCSMGDWMHKDVPIKFIDNILDTISACPQHTFFTLTKRPENLKKKLHGIIMECYPNLWLGVSVEDQKTADERIPLLLQTPAVNRFVSYEPALGPVDFKKYLYHEDCDDFDCDLLACSMTSIGRGIEWIIMGGETGPGARPMHPDWARKVRDDCNDAGVPFFMKKMSGGQPAPKDLMIRDFPEEVSK